MRSRVPTRAVSSRAVFSAAFFSTLTLTPMLILVGCAHADNIADRHFAEMGETIGHVQAEQDRSNERLGMLAAQDERGARAPETSSAAPKPAGRATPPVPRTVQIGEGEEGGESDDPNDPTARPEIRLQGAPGATYRPLRGKSVSRGRGEARSETGDDNPRGDATKRGPATPAATDSRNDTRGAGPKESR